MSRLVEFLIARRVDKAIHSGPFSGGGSDFAEEVQGIVEQSYWDQCKDDVLKMLAEPEGARRSCIVHS